MTPDGHTEAATATVSAEPVYRRLYEQLRDSILAGQFTPGSKLPPSRILAADHGISRNTVVAAFDQLYAEGYIDARQGSGTFVARVLPEDLLTASPPMTPVDPSASSAGLSRRGTAIAATPRVPLPSLTGVSSRATPFQIGLPSLEDFPADTWARLYSARLRHASQDLLSYNDPAGYRPFRQAIASYVGSTRGIRCTADQVVVVSGSQQALEFCARLLLDPGDTAWLEDPGYLGARAALVSADAKIVPVPVDHDGIVVTAGIEREPSARLAMVTPSYQFPLGVTMSLERRLALLDWASHAGSWIVEDDYDCEFRYIGRPLAALQAIDRHSRVIYIGTFSKTLFPALRLAYLVVPPQLVDAFRAVHLSTDMHAHLLDQAVLADFIETGGFTRHLRRMRLRYQKRQQFLVDSAEHLRDRLRVERADGGLHLTAYLGSGDDAEIAARAARAGVHVWPLSLHCIEADQPPALLLGYAGCKTSAISTGVRALERVLDNT